MAISSAVDKDLRTKKNTTKLIDSDGGVSEEELVHAGNEDGPDGTDDSNTQARKVDEGIVGLSVLVTADRTSGYGDSSSSAGAVGSKFGSSWSSMAMSCVLQTRCVSHSFS
jgi:hypothetical protein